MKLVSAQHQQPFTKENAFMIQILIIGSPNPPNTSLYLIVCSHQLVVDGGKRQLSTIKIWEILGGELMTNPLHLLSAPFLWKCAGFGRPVACVIHQMYLQLRTKKFNR